MSQQQAIISGTGLYVPPHSISNEELVQSFNAHVDAYNQTYQEAITKGDLPAKEYSSASFIEKASGILNRHVMDKEGILDPVRMRPYLRPRDDEEPSIQCEMACKAIEQALARANKTPRDLDGVIVSCAVLQRAYPGIAVEIQHHLGINGYGFDMNMACSSSTFGIATACNAIKNQQNKCLAVVVPEVTSGHVDFRDRDSHFIFGDICTAVIVEQAQQQAGFEIIGTKLQTTFSNNIRNNFGFLTHTEIPTHDPLPLLFFKQNGRKVFKEVVPMVEEHILSHLAEFQLQPSDLRRYWLHQANINMNELIIKKVLGRDATRTEAPIILDQYANTASAGSLVAFHHYHDDLKPGEMGIICSFGAGYSIGSVIVRKSPRA